MKRAAIALAALAMASVALAQQTSPPPPADDRARMSEPDKQTLMKDCVTQVQAANPSVPEKDVRAYCEKQVNSYSSSPRD